MSCPKTFLLETFCPVANCVQLRKGVTLNAPQEFTRTEYAYTVDLLLCLNTETAIVLSRN